MKRGAAMQAGLSAALALAVVLAPEIGQACSVCFSGRDESRAAFTATTILLTGLPLAMLGGMVWWLRQRARQVAGSEHPPASR